MNRMSDEVRQKEQTVQDWLQAEREKAGKTPQLFCVRSMNWEHNRHKNGTSGTIMKRPTEITTLFLDIGGVLLHQRVGSSRPQTGSDGLRSVANIMPPWKGYEQTTNIPQLAKPAA
jgi:hypothetical protein